MNEESEIDFNFWPAFADLMLAVVLILCLVLFWVSAVIALGTVNLKTVEDNQQNMIELIAAKYHVQPMKLDKQIYGISTDNSGTYDIKVQNDLNEQRITFSDKILFGPDETVINAKGQQALLAVGENLRNQLNSIREIQIQGHADTNKTRFALNIRLASERAIAVFEFLRTQVGIDPTINLMSATSFGEYRSVQRGQNESPYSKEEMEKANATDALRGQNRRIELVLIYRR